MKTMKANGSFLSLLRHSFVGGKQKTGIGLSFGYLEMDDDSVPAAFFSLAQWRQGCAFRTPSGRWFECSFLANKRPIFCPFISTIWFPPLWRTDIPFFRLSWSPFGGNCPECALFLIARLLSEDKGNTLLHYSLLEAANLFIIYCYCKFNSTSVNHFSDGFNRFLIRTLSTILIERKAFLITPQLCEGHVGTIHQLAFRNIFRCRPMKN